MRAQRREGIGDPAWRNPITGIAGCCARAASGQSRRAAEKRDELAPLSLDHLVGAGKQRRRHLKAKRLARFED